MRPWALVLLLGCGGDARLEMRFDGLSLSDVSELQLSVVSDRDTVDCAAVTLSCVKDQFPASRFVDLTDASGRSAKAVRFSTDAGVAVSLAPGRDFAFVIEAVSSAQLAGSSCTYVEELRAGSNRVSANAITLRADAGAIAACDPRF